MNSKESAYMKWAKTCSLARFNLASSGVASFPLRLLEADLASIEINGKNIYGSPPLQQAIAHHTGARPECVLQAEGTSMANHLVMGALLDPGDEVVLEFPAYGPLLDVARYLRLELKRFHRREENGWQIEPEEVGRAVSGKTKMIILTNPHNPTSVSAPLGVLKEIGQIAERSGAHVLVDEVYLETNYDVPPRSAFDPGGRFIVTNSLTKAYGLSGLRCGWVLAEPDLAWKIRHFNDLFGSVPVHPGEQLSVAAFRKLPLLRQTGASLVKADRNLLAEFFAEESSLRAVPTSHGTTSFPRLLKGDVN